MPKKQTLEELRAAIDTIDDRILDLLNERATLVLRVGKVKEAERRAFYVPNREREIY